MPDTKHSLFQQPGIQTASAEHQRLTNLVWVEALKEKQNETAVTFEGEACILRLPQVATEGKKYQCIYLTSMVCLCHSYGYETNMLGHSGANKLPFNQDKTGERFMQYLLCECISLRICLKFTKFHL